MALITCPDCGSSVSDAAPACIRCGRPLAAARATPAPAMEPRPVDPKAARAAAAKPVAIVGYALQVLAFLYFIPAIVALIIAYARRNDARGTWVESHFDWQIETFWNSLWWVLGGIVLGVVLGLMADSPVPAIALLYGVGLGVTLWYIYRVVRGGLALYDEEPIG